MAVTGQKVSFVYVSSGELPQSADQNTVYFLPGEEGGLYVGNTLIADNSVADITDLDNRVSALEDGGIVVVIDSSQVPSGQTADYVQGASFDSATKTLTLTLGTLASNTTITGITNDITDINTAIGDLEDAVNDLETNKLDATNGEATGLTLSADPTTDMGAATKQYVDNAVEGLSGAMHFKGVSSTSITDGGTETATIGGQPLAAESGDVVIYGDKEFVWAGTFWNEFGDLSDQSSFALKSTQIIAGTGLTGGGTLEANRTISHQAAPTSGASGNVTKSITTDTTGTLYVQGGVEVDALGHVADVVTKDIYSQVVAIANEAAGDVEDIIDGLALSAGTGITLSGTSIVTNNPISISHQAAPQPSASGNTSKSITNDSEGHLYVQSGVEVDALGHVASVASKDIFTAVETIAGDSCADLMDIIDAISITGSNGLTGGGTIANAPLVISHATAPSTSTDSKEIPADTSSTLYVASGVNIDAYGHVVSARAKDIASEVEGIADTAVSDFATTTSVTAGTGLTGGGTLNTSGGVTLNHQALPATGATGNVDDDIDADTTGHIYVMTGVEKDALGHVVDVHQKDIYSQVEAVALTWTVI